MIKELVYEFGTTIDLLINGTVYDKLEVGLFLFAAILAIVFECLWLRERNYRLRLEIENSESKKCALTPTATATGLSEKVSSNFSRTISRIMPSSQKANIPDRADATHFAPPEYNVGGVGGRSQETREKGCQSIKGGTLSE